MKYLVAYGHVVRCEKASTPEEAMRLAYGMVDKRQMTVVESSKLPRQMSVKELKEMEKKLAVKHFHRTGSIISGYENEPGIANTHWTECQLCRFPITTEPAAQGLDDALCMECQPKYFSLTEEEREGLSIAKMRERLGIVIK